MDIDPAPPYTSPKLATMAPFGTSALQVSLTVWNEAYIMLVSCIDYALDMTCIQSVSQCFIVAGIL